MFLLEVARPSREEHDGQFWFRADVFSVYGSMSLWLREKYSSLSLSATGSCIARIPWTLDRIPISRRRAWHEAGSSSIPPRKPCPAKQRGRPQKALDPETRAALLLGPPPCIKVLHFRSFFMAFKTSVGLGGRKLVTHITSCPSCAAKLLSREATPSSPST